MIETLDQFLIGIAIGVRFRANFSIEDQLGRIVDQILYSKGSYFNPKIFPLAESNVGKRLLINPETDDKLRIDNSNIILEIQFGTTFKTKQIKEILSKFEGQIIKQVMKTFSIKEIVRIGYIRRYLFNLQDLAKTFVDKTIGETLGGVNDINLRFSKKLPVEVALAKESVNDYNNAIFNIIKKADRDEIFMSVDFQKYFDPFLPSYAEIGFRPFIEDANAFNNSRYLSWLNSNYVEIQNDK